MREGSLLLLVMIVGSIIVLVSVVWIMWDYYKGKKLVIRADEEKAELKAIIADAELMVNELNNFSDYIITRIDEKNSEADDFLERLDKTLTSVISSDEERPVEESADEKSADEERPDEESAGDECPVGFVDIRACGHVIEDRNTVIADGLPSLRSPTRSLTQTEDVRADTEHKPRRHTGAFRISRAQWRFAGFREKRPVVQPLVLYPVENQDSVVHARMLERNKRRADALRGNKKCANVFALAANGMDEAMIARSLGIGRGEVALILDLGGGKGETATL